jgi:hypothetical protein
VKLLDSSHRDLLMIVHDFATVLACREYYCLGAASVLSLIMRKRLLDEKRSK